jgi:MFS family permease
LNLQASFRSFGRPARLFLLATIINGIIFSSWQLFFNFFILSRGFDKNYLGLVNSAPSAAALLLAVPFGIFSDRIGRKRAMLAGLLLATLCQVATVLFAHPVLIIAMSFLGGAGNSLYFISMSPFMVKTSTPANRTLLFSMNFGLTTLAGAAGNLFAGQLPGVFGRLLGVAPDSTLAYQGVLLASVMVGSLALIPIFLIKEPASHIEAEGQRPRRPLRQVLFQPLVFKLVAPNLLIGLGAAILVPYMNVFFVERYAVSDQNLGVMFSLASLLTGIGCIAGPPLAVRLGGKILTVVLTQAGSLVFLLAMGFSPVLPFALVGFLMRGVLMNMAAPLYGAFAMEQITPSEQGTANSMLSLSWQAGWAVGPYISGVVQNRWGFSPLFIATAVLYGIAVCLTWVFFYKQEQPVFGSTHRSTPTG